MISEAPKWQSYKEAPIKGSWFMRWLKSRFRFVDYPFLLAYRGFGNRTELILQGHVFRAMALSRPRKRYSAWRNFVSLVKMFLVRTVPNARVALVLNNKEYYVHTNKTGFYEFRIEAHGLQAGWHSVQLRLEDKLVEGQEDIHLDTEVYIRDTDFAFGCISDIDDTFLVSHITKILRKLYVLLTKNAETRKPFKGVVDFYQGLQKGEGSTENPFFYVSSSEWNLYDFLVNFMSLNDLPKGPLLLKDIKDHWRDFFRAGFGNHNHKEQKIERILALHPHKRFILLGDNGQHDPHIYHRIAQRHPHQVLAIYIRAVKRSHRKEVNDTLAEIEAMDIPSLQFKRSSEAMAHAVAHGFIAEK